MDAARRVEFENRRTWNWIILGTMYAFFYMGRYNFASAHSAIAEALGWGYTDYGKILTPALIVYGLSVFFNGPLCDKIGGKTSILIGAVGAAIANLLFGLTSLLVLNQAIVDPITHKVLTPAILHGGMSMMTMLSMMTFIWVANNYFQSFGALSVVKINTKWFQIHERGRLAGLFSIPIQIGRFLGTYICIAIVHMLPWQYIFWIPSVFLAVMFYVGKRCMFEAPEDLGYQYFDTHVIDKEKVKISLVLKKVFANPTMWIIAALSMCLGFVRNGIDHWYPMYFQRVFHIGATDTVTFAPFKFVSVSVPIIMIATGFIAGYLSDKVFNSKRGPIIFFSFLGQIIFLGLLAKYIFNPWVAAISLMGILGSIQAGHCLMAATASMDFGGRKAAATAAGFIDGMQYLAGAIMGYGMGRLLDAHKVVGNIGYEFWIWPLACLPLAVVGIALSLVIWNTKPSKDH